jgi:hypothetical protein
MVLDSITYSIPYVCLVIYYIMLYFFESYISKQGDNAKINLQLVKLLSVLGILIFFGFRGFISWDWTAYYPAFRDIPQLFSLNAAAFKVTRFEPGFVIYISILKFFCNNYHFFIFISTLIDLLILLLVLKRFNSGNFSLSFLLFLVFGGFYLETDLLRNAKSIMLFFLSLKYLSERKMLPYMLLNLVGCMFHFSSILFIPLYFFLHKTISKKAVIIIFITGLLLFLLRIEYIIPAVRKIAGLLGENTTQVLNKYIKNNLYSGGYGITIGLMERILTATLIVIFYRKLITKNTWNVIFINSYLIYFIFFFFFAEFRIIPIRVGGLFAFSYWVLYPAIAEVFERKNNRYLFISFIFLYSLVKIAGMTDNILYRYDNVLTGAESYKSRQAVFDKTSSYFLK